MQDQTSKIKEVLPVASIRDNSVLIFAHVSKVISQEIKELLPLGLLEINRSGAGITLTFKMTN